ncbi:MAG: hypothetical protein GY894_09190 [Planctomycetes bacterium]|nr:hypothetical protein [Planctomycetota bacterium]MCP4839517.1 hypothetical protein [Planctomycetota bacterium]
MTWVFILVAASTVFLACWCIVIMRSAEVVRKRQASAKELENRISELERRIDQNGTQEDEFKA